MAKQKKQKVRRPRAETPRGFRDYFGADVTARAAMLNAITEVYHRYGFDALETSAVETVEALGKFLPDVDRPNAGVFGWQDEDESWMALRYDLTAPLARVYAQNHLKLPTPYRRYAVGPVWRNEKPGPGRYRQFYQCDADTVGSASPAADAEICAMLCDALEAAGISRGDYIIRINNRKVLNGVMEVVGLLDPTNPDQGEEQRGVVLRAIDKLDRLGDQGVRALLGEGRKDDSGAYTEGAKLNDDQAELGKFLPDVDRPNAGVFGWQDEDESWMALRYDLTAPLARVYAQNHLKLPTPYRRYAVGPVWRNEKPGPGRYRQFYQCDADTVGSASPAADAEICAMLCDALEAAGISRGDYIIRINNRKVLNGVMEVVGLLDPTNPDQGEEQRGVVLRAIDKLDRLGDQGVRALLGEGRKDDSGAYTEGAKLNDDQAELVMGFVRAERATGADTCARLRELVSDSATGLEGVAELEVIAELLTAQGYSKRAKIDPSVVRGLGYYTGPVYEAELTFEITDEKGRKRQFGSVAGGGRYDDLVMRFTGQRVPGTGVSIGVDRLLAALEAKRGAPADADGPVLVTVMDKSRLADYQTMVGELRSAGIRAEMFLGGGNMAKQLKYADKRACPVAIIEGGDEHEAGVVQLKDLALGARLAAEIETNEEWKAQPAQVSVPRHDLVSEVRAMIARREG